MSSTSYELKNYFEKHHLFLSQFNEQFLNYRSRNVYQNAEILYSMFEDIAHKRYKYILFFSLITLDEYENIIRKFFYIVYQWKIKNHMFEMFNYFEKKYFYIALRRYTKKFKNKFSLDDRKILEIVKDYDIILRLLQNKVIESYTVYESFSFSKNPKQAVKIRYREKRLSVFITETINILNRFYLIRPDFQCQLQNSFLRLFNRFEKMYSKHLSKMKQCNILSDRLPYDICVHVLYHFL